MSFIDQPEFADDVRAVLSDLLGLPTEFMNYLGQYMAMNPLSIPISQVTGFAQFTVQVGNYVDTQQTTTSTTFTDLGTVGPTLSELPNGHYLVALGCQAFTDAANFGARMSIDVNGAGAAHMDECMTSSVNLLSVSRLTTATLSSDNANTMTAKYLSDNNTHTATFGKRWLIALKYANL